MSKGAEIEAASGDGILILPSLLLLLPQGQALQ
jgi:hypothetical protein